ncbi:hypothetical protein [Pararhodonellum marinum]|uniref:hypothetical protein n=1 Tax=Pararhodonellum marinum TaxID=2755358 RepID=UPI00188FAFA6|nr:hypothetical protein [Pararhodonellum marinum]
MKTKIQFTCLLFVLLPFFAHAQSIDGEIAMIQSAFGMEKRALVSNYMNLPESSSNAFWSVYQAYEEERQSISRERIKIINDYLEKLDNLGEIEADALATRTLKNDQALARLHAKYYKRFKKATSSLEAAKFLQIDNYIHSSIRMALQENLPFIGEK